MAIALKLRSAYFANTPEPRNRILEPRSKVLGKYCAEKPGRAIVAPASAN